MSLIRRPKALDLYSCAGGASRGLVEAGFDVTGVDIDAQPEYPVGPHHTFIQSNVFAIDIGFIRQFDFVWASPPCQAFTSYKRRTDHVKPALNLIPWTRTLLEAAGVPYIIENVTGAKAHLRNPIMLCGSMFGLDVQRHRLFELGGWSIDPAAKPACNHKVWAPNRFPGATNRNRGDVKNTRSTVEVGVWRIPLDVQQKAMGGLPLSLEKLSQAIPPSYSKWLGEAAMVHMNTNTAQKGVEAVS